MTKEENIFEKMFREQNEKIAKLKSKNSYLEFVIKNLHKRVETIKKENEKHTKISRSKINKIVKEIHELS